MSYAPVKRAFDICFSACFLIIFSPIMGLVALLIRCSGKPVTYTQVRLGRDGKEFIIYKFRTMVLNARKLHQEKNIPNAKLITRVGRIIRPLYLDEFPQFLNILKGEMSFIGPRPITPFDYEQAVSFKKVQDQILTVKPGLSGLDEVMQYLTRKEAEHIKKIFHIHERKDVPLRKMVDLFYTKHFSFWLDVRIVMWTIKSFIEHVLKLLFRKSI